MYWMTVLVVVYTVWLGLGWLIQRRVLFPRHFTAIPKTAGQPGTNIQWIESDRARIEMWFITGNGVDANHPGPVVIFAHGNAELIQQSLWLDAMFYTGRGISVALVEYRGYGNSTGTPSQSGITADYTVAYDRIAKRDDVDPRQIIFHGRSLGGGVVCSLARHRKPAAIVLQSTFTSVKAMAGRFGIPPFAVRDPFDNRAVLKQYDGPVLIMHGEHDSIIPASHGQKLAEATPNAQLELFDSDHNDFPVNSQRYSEVLMEFFTRHGLLENPESSVRPSAR